MLEKYLPILLFMIIGLGVGLMPVVLNTILAPRQKNAQKESPYECGFPAFQDARIPFKIRYALIAILFIIFDLEMAFLFPFALVIRKIGLEAFIGMGIFLGLLVLGFLYEWRKGALEWE